MKKAVILLLLLFLLAGAVSASEDLNSTDNELSIGENPKDDISFENTSSDTLKQRDDIKIESNESQVPAVETPSITSPEVIGSAGKTITLKTVVKTSSCPTSGVKVTFKLNKKTCTGTTNGNGVCTVKVKCPATAVLKTAKKTKGRILTKTTTYSKTYTCSVTVEGDGLKKSSSSFSVISKKSKAVKKYKIIKKKKIITIPVKKGMKTYKKGNYIFIMKKISKGSLNYLGLGAAGKKERYIKFSVKDHLRCNGKWSWDDWYKVKKGKIYEFTYPNSLKVDKVKVKYTQVTQKRIK